MVTTAPRVAPKPAAAPPPLGVGVGGGAANFADVAERINAAVVNIDATTKGPALRDSQRFFRRGPNDPLPRDFESPGGAGSGFIIDREGFILTNHHVIENAERITVTLADGRTFRGEVVGTDPAIDVALLRIAGAKDLPEAPLGNSDELRVGEWVCAIGNPLGYVHSVTVGVVSFIGRKLFDASLDDYIQTDAAINFGNSGGPLINTRGEVIGINSAVSSRASSIGFAVPINQAVAILPQLKASGRVARGYIGVLLTDVTPALQRALALDVARGAMVQDINADSPAERAGLRVYDVIVDVEGRDIAANDDLIRDISGRSRGRSRACRSCATGGGSTVPIRLTERPQSRAVEDVTPATPGNRGPRPATARARDAARTDRPRARSVVHGAARSARDSRGGRRHARRSDRRGLLGAGAARVRDHGDQPPARALGGRLPAHRGCREARRRAGAALLRSDHRDSARVLTVTVE